MNETRLSRLVLPVGAPVGRLASGAPVYPFVGAAKDDGMTAEPDDEESDDEPEDDKKGSDKYVAPDRAEWLRTQAALAKANASAKQRREALAAAEAEIQKLKDAEAAREAKAERDALTKGTAKKKTAAGGGVKLPEGTLTPAQARQLAAQAAREADTKAAEKFRSQVVGHAARAALVDAGVSKASATRLSKLLDLDEIGVDEDGEITDGLDEQIAQLRAEMPQLFAPAEKKPPRRQPPGKANGADRPAGEGERRLSSAERMAQQALGVRT